MPRAQTDTGTIALPEPVSAPGGEATGNDSMRVWLMLSALLFAAGISVAKPPIMKSSELKTGMKGYGLSVFNGTEPERFGVTIVGVVKGRNVGRDMILADLEHPILERIGVIAGMSGSPVFIDDKMIGAVAYGWGDSVRALAGIQPIEGMLDVFDLTKDSPPVPQRLAPSTDFWPEAQAARAASANWFSPASEIDVPLAELERFGITLPPGRTNATFRPLASPLAIGSTDPALLKLFEEHLGPGRVVPVGVIQEGVAPLAHDDLRQTKIVNGSAVGVAMIEGDLSVTAIGTATYVEDDRLIAYGHPLDNEGTTTEMPASKGYIAGIAPVQGFPFKISYSVEPLGTMVQDRFPAIGIIRNRRPRMIPMEVRIDARAAQAQKTYKYQLVNSRRHTGFLSEICVREAIQSIDKQIGHQSAQILMRIALANGESIERREFVSGDNGVSALASGWVSTPVNALVSNPVEAVEIDRIDVDITLGDAVQLAVMRNVKLPKTVWRQGELLSGTAEFVRYREPNFELPFAVPIPDDLPDGRYELHLIDNAVRSVLQTRVTPALKRRESAADYVNALKVSYPGNGWWAVLFDPAPRPVIHDGSLQGLPRSIGELSGQVNRTQGTMRNEDGTIVTESAQFFDFEVGGARWFPIEVRRNGNSSTGLVREP